MNFNTYFSKQAKEPFGWVGKVIMSKVFDYGNTFLNTFMLEVLALKENDHILEIGFGTGKLIFNMAKLINGGLIEGIDISNTMLVMAKKKTKKHIDTGKVIINQGDFENFTYNDNSFDKICSSNTIYFWQNPDIYIKKIQRILKPGGKVVLAFEDKEQLEKRTLDSEIFKFYGLDEIVNLFKTNGLDKDINIFTREKGPQKFHCAVAFK